MVTNPTATPAITADPSCRGNPVPVEIINRTVIIIAISQPEALLPSQLQNSMHPICHPKSFGAKRMNIKQN